MKVILLVFLLVCLAMFSVFLSHFTINSDFPIYYYAARTIVDPNSPNESVYALDTMNKFATPEHVEPPSFIYSMAAAYLLAPLALMPYYTAKAVMIFINIVAYIGALTIVAKRINGAAGRSLFYPVILSCLWLPFLQNLRSGQVNAILLLLVSIAAAAANDRRPILSGISLGAASLFKVFPAAVALVLALRKWSIAAACALVVGAALLLPGALQWFTALGNVYRIYAPFYPKLSQIFGTTLYYAYALTIAGATIFLVLKCRKEKPAMIVSFTIPAVFLIMPIIHYYHLTLMSFCYVYLVTSERKADIFLMPAQFLSAVLIISAFFFSPSSDCFSIRPHLSHLLLMTGIFLSWASLGWTIYSDADGGVLFAKACRGAGTLGPEENEG